MGQVTDFKKEIDEQMQLLLNTLKPLCLPDAELEADLAKAAPGEMWQVGLTTEYFVQLRETYKKINELCIAVIETSKKEKERRVIL